LISKVKVFRYNPLTDAVPRFEKYDVPLEDGARVLDALVFIRDSLGVDLAFRYSCKSGVCGTCSVLVNGEPCCACRREAEPSMIVEPLPSFPTIRDLVVDRSSADRRLNRTRSFLEARTVPQPYARLRAAEITDYKKVAKCIECYSCVAACPVVGKPGAFNYIGPSYMIGLAQLAFDPLDSGERGRTAYYEGVYDCTTCAKCSQVCPKEIAVPETTIEKLRELAVRAGLGPLDAHRRVARYIRETGRSVEKVTPPFLDALAGAPLGVPREKAGFFTGCLIDYRLQRVGEATVSVLRKLGIEVEPLKGQVCCGSPLLRTGQRGEIVDLVKRNCEVIANSGVDLVLTVCAGCGKTLRRDYPPLIKQAGLEQPSWRVLDITEFLLKRLTRSAFSSQPSMKVTYHDPCHLRRGLGVFREPREVIRMIPGVEFVEMEKPDLCCGAGGGVRSGDRPLSMLMARDKANLIRGSGADAVVTVCSFCQLQLSDVLEGCATQTLNITELLDRSLKASTYPQPDSF